MPRLARCLGALSLLSLCAPISIAHAQIVSPANSVTTPPVAPVQGAPQASAEAQAIPPDLIRTIDGGMVRGTILEYVPNQYAVIRLASGEVRRIAGAEIRYAGPAGEGGSALAPSATPSTTVQPPSTAPASPAPPLDANAVGFETSQPSLSLHLRTENTPPPGTIFPGGYAPPAVVSFRPLCSLPCQVSLPSGRQRLAVSLGARGPVRVRGGLDVHPGARFQVAYRSRKGARVAGGVIMALTAAGGGWMIAHGMKEHDARQQASAACGSYCASLPSGAPLIAIGAAVGGVGFIAGISMVTRRDVVRIAPLDARR